MIYLTGHTGEEVDAYRAHPRLGLMAQPGTYSVEVVERWRTWAADNGCFALKGEPFERDRWLRWLDRLRDLAPRCLFVTAPDVLHWEGENCRGDARATLIQAQADLPLIRSLGFPAALVLQDGMTAELVPWGAVDAVFVGGSDRFKLGAQVPRIVAEANRRGVHTHMGRVNSRRRMLLAAAMGCRSTDGTHLRYGPRTNLPGVLSWLAAVDAQARPRWPRQAGVSPPT